MSAWSMSTDAYHIAEYKGHGCGKHKLVSGWQFIPEASKQLIEQAIPG